MKSIKLLISSKLRDFLLASCTYITISIFFLFGVIISQGDVAQQDWSIPVTASGTLAVFSSTLFSWSYNGFGSANKVWGFPFFEIINAALGQIGFFGGAEIKLLAVFLVALGGITAYALAKSLGLRRCSSFLVGLFFMTTPIVFNWLMFGWIFYLIAYDLLPLFLIAAKKFLETSDLRYALVSGIILSIATTQVSFILIYPVLGFLLALFESKGNVKIFVRGIVVTIVSILIWFLTYLNFMVSLNSSNLLSFYQGSFLAATIAQFSHLSNILNPIRLWGSTFNYQFETYFAKELTILSFVPLIIAVMAIAIRPRDRHVLFAAFAYLFVFAAYFSYENMSYIVLHLPYGSIFEAPSVFLVPASEV